jgi:hypothetical protein
MHLEILELKEYLLKNFNLPQFFLETKNSKPNFLNNQNNIETNIFWVWVQSKKCMNMLKISFCVCGCVTNEEISVNHRWCGGK